MNEKQAEQLRAEAADLAAEDLLAWAARRFGPRAALASSLSAEDQVLTDMIARAALPIAIFTLDTGRLPQETYDVLEATRQRYGLDIEVLFPDRADIEKLTRERGPNCFRRSVEDRRLCCRLRKVKPLQRRLAGLDAWITGLRRQQAPTRTDLPTVAWDGEHGLLKLNPLVDWTEAQLWQYVRQNQVPYNRLHDQGYTSIGCAPCTRAVAPGEDIRAGRWWWEKPEHKECGLHLTGGQSARNRQQSGPAPRDEL